MTGKTRDEKSIPLGTEKLGAGGQCPLMQMFQLPGYSAHLFYTAEGEGTLVNLDRGSSLRLQASGSLTLWLVLSAHTVYICTQSRGRLCYCCESEPLVSLARPCSHQQYTFTQDSFLSPRHGTGQHLSVSLWGRLRF